MTRYEAYKDSGIEWLGEIPSHWQVKKLKYIIKSLTSGGTPESSKEEYYSEDDKGVPFVTISDITQSEYIQFTQKYLTSLGVKSKNLTIYPEHTLLYSIYATIGKVAELLKPSCINQAILAIELLNIANRQYVKYILKTIELYVISLTSSNTQSNLNAEKVLNYILPLPPLEEQERIATYLDKQTAKIDSLIAHKEKLIGLLKERRSALISETVTKGLNPSAPLKDSGIEWLGKIPSHWQVKKLKYLAEMNTGLSITKAELQDEGCPCLGYGAIHSKYTFELDLAKHSLPFADESYLTSYPRTIARVGDFVFCDTSEDIEGSGNMLYISNTDNKQIIAGMHTILMRFIKPTCHRYKAYLFKSAGWKSQVQSKVSGVKVFSITQTILKSTFIIIPPLEEQEQIVAFLDKQTGKIDMLTARIEANILKLKEYRQALISELVTGKKKV